MKDSLLKSAVPHLVAVLIFTVLSFVYFYPVLEGKKINAHDTKVFEGSSREIRDFRAEYGKEPLWTNSMFGGMPAYMISAKYPGNLFKHLDDLLKIYKTPVAALVPFDAGLLHNAPPFQGQSLAGNGRSHCIRFYIIPVRQPVGRA